MNLEKIQPGDVILTWAKKNYLGSLPIRVANFFKRGYQDRGWTHTVLYAGNDTIIEALPEGILQHSLTEKYLNGKFDLLVLRRKNTSPQALEKTIAFCAEQASASEKYDFRGLIYFLLYNFIPLSLHFILDNDFMDSIFNVKNAYFCSELVAEGLLKAEIYSFEKAPYKIMPVDFYNNFWFDVVESTTEPPSHSIWTRFKSAVIRTFYFLSSLIFPLLLLAISILPLLMLTFLFVYLPSLLRSRKD